ncbi:MAG: hypothetical protein RQ728_10325, partial [Brevefilum sp.]|nr:hypothetical protein [Brevefilum sp.]
MPRKETSRTDWYPIAMTLIFGAVLAACTPEGQAQETRPAVTQTIENYNPSEEITLEAGVETEVQTFTPTASQTPEASATPENTPTVTATATPENTATPERTIPDWPDNIDFQFRIDKENLGFNDWGEGYLTKGIPLYIRTEDLHLDEPFTLGDGRFHVQGWADAWFMETDGTRHHITVPIMIFNTETLDVWSFIQTIETWPNLDINDQSDEAIQIRKDLTEKFTGPFRENFFAMYW